MLLAVVGCASHRTFEAFETPLKWEPAKTVLTDRMRVAPIPSADDPVYRALWIDNGRCRLVAMRENPNHLFGDTYDVVLFDSDGTILRVGEVRTYNGHTPYGLFEVKRENIGKPQGGDAWELAVGFARKGAVYTAAEPFKVEDGTNSEDAEQGGNWLSLEPVGWKDEPTNFGVHALYPDGERIIYRWAECGANDPTQKPANH
jgi:hypothetical protein